MCKPSDTPKTNAVEYASAKVQPSRMVVDADWARTLEREAAMWKQAAEILADALVKETDCDADESCPCSGCQSLAQYEKIKRAAAKCGGKNCQVPEEQEEREHDDGDENYDGPEMPECPACRGSGKYVDATSCPECDGDRVLP